MYFKIYLYVFFFSKAFSKTSSSIIFEISLHASYFDEEICIDIDSIQIPGYWNLYLMQIAIGDNQDNPMFILLLRGRRSSRRSNRYQTIINAVPSSSQFN